MLILDNLSEEGKKVWDYIEYGIQSGKTNTEIYDNLLKNDLAYNRRDFFNDIKEYRVNRKYFHNIWRRPKKEIILDRYYRPVAPKQPDAILASKKYITKFMVLEADEDTGVEDDEPRFTSISHDEIQSREELELGVYALAKKYKKEILQVTPVEGIYNPYL